MSLETPQGRPPAGEDDALLVDGLELAVAQARTKIPDHDNEPNVVLPTPNGRSEAPTAAELAVDSSAVMEVLRGAIARYTTEDAREQGTWSAAVPLPTPRPGTTRGARHAAAGYSPDRRRLAAAVVVLFLLIGGFGYQQLGTGKSSSVKTAPPTTFAGHAVTTLARPTTTVTVPAETAPPETEAPAPAGTSRPATTVKRVVPPPPTDPPPTDPPTTTIPEETTTSTTTTTTPPCNTIVEPCP
ncbi:MAG: hypothetical protein QOD92_3344 [Acidimicrobiaceae bacterium]|jgi:hypothetical protein